MAGEEWNCKDLMDQATNPAMRSDVLRLEILHRYGGIYADIDSVALRSFGRRAGLNMQTIILNNPRSSLFRELSDIHKDTKGKLLFLSNDIKVICI